MSSPNSVKVGRKRAVNDRDAPPNINGPLLVHFVRRGPVGKTSGAHNTANVQNPLFAAKSGGSRRAQANTN
eukprot:6085724-Prorocentrum_lima.AAC.1